MAANTEVLIVKILIQNFKIQQTCNMAMRSPSNIGPLVVFIEITGRYKALEYWGVFNRFTPNDLYI